MKTVDCEQSGQWETWLVHYRDDMLAHAAVGDEYGMIDNVAALPLRHSEVSGYEAEWLLLFTNKGDN